jgi:hypothetical protein
MAKSPSLLGIWILCAGIVVLLFVTYQTSEGFASSVVPDSCGKYGWNFSKGLLNVAKQATDLKLGGTFPDSFLMLSKEIRQYTPAECDKLGGTFYQPTQFGTLTGMIENMCIKLKDPSKGITESNVVRIFGGACAGLNAQSTPGPLECSANGKPLGVPNKGLPIVFEGKNIIIPDGTFQLYTKEECGTLEGNLVTVNSIEEETKFSRKQLAELYQIRLEDLNTYLQLNGENVGVCISKDGRTVYSLACAATGSPSVLQSAWSSVVGT